MPITFDRSICCDLNETVSREWLITNGLGSYAAGTIAGTLTRLQHGLLVASSSEDTSPRLLLAKIDEEIHFDQRTYYLGTNEYRDGTINPAGFVHLENFHLEEGFPVFTYRIGGIDGILLEKRIWMTQACNTTYIQYRVLRSTTSESYIHQSSFSNGFSRNLRSNNGRSYHQQSVRDPRVLTLTLLPFAAYRLYNEHQHGNNDWHFQVQTHQADDFSFEADKLPSGHAEDEIAGCTIRARDGAQPSHIYVVGHAGSETTFLPTGVWYWHFLRRLDQATTDDLYLPGVFRANLWPEEDSKVTIIATTEELSSQIFNTRQLTLSYKNAVEYQHNSEQPHRYFGEGGDAVHTLPVLPITNTTHSSETDEEFIQLLRQAGSRFFAERTIPYGIFSSNHFPSPFFNETETVPILIPGYFDMQDNIREMLIALPGLTLATGQFSKAQHILHYLARYFKQGILPGRLPTSAHPLQEDDYGSIDTTLWYFYALDHYLRVSHDFELLDDVYQRLVDNISWYSQGTYQGIHADKNDGLLITLQSEAALTWMNARVNHVPVTPRQGKAVEVNALWYNALCLMDEWSKLLYQKGRINHSTSYYLEQSNLCKQNFNQRFWYSAGHYLYDVVDGPGGDDLSLRPNQLLAISLRYPILDQEHRKSVLDIVTEQLLTPFGLRTLAPNDSLYHGHLQANREEQQGALHQGSAWTWLLGPYFDALLGLETLTTSSKTSQDFTPPLERVWYSSLRLLKPFQQLFNEGMLGILPGVFDGDAPHASGYNAASATGTGEILRLYNHLAHLGVRYQKYALTI